MPHTFEELTRAPQRRLHALWLKGIAPGPEEIAGHIYRGRNTARLARLGPGGGAFAKGFVHTDLGLDGCNFPVTVKHGEWRVEATQPFGFFRVEPTHAATFAGRPQFSLLLDYGEGRAAAYRQRGAPRPPLPWRVVELFARPLRDVLVQPPDCADGVLLGRAYTAGVPITFFVLERWQPLTAEWGRTDRALEHPKRRVS